MRSYINIICLAIIAAIIFAAPNNTLSLHRPVLSAMDKRNIGKDHTGYQCGSTKHKMNKILDAIQMACPDPAQSDSFWFSYNDSGFPKTFSEAQRLGLPKDTMITPVRGGFFDQLQFHYAAFEPVTCKLRGVIRQKDNKKDGVFQLCQYTTWPLSWTDPFHPG
ncbi:CSEP0195 putative effector protein [Blumeria hordei DH14]|uniref:CSEP0195 putative effector protein n=1 Tax=Blumeria graminis f. sp. hordei (strain DH14) TaxID=546991 RepID=N1JML4_BLUG1|nr:CSEP0195 putative effector protein [Blumeria hordei DH14]